MKMAVSDFMWLSGIILAISGYLIGSVNFAILFTRHYAGVDVRDYGSGNAGMTNVLRVAGKGPAIITFVCDFLKGAFCVLLGKLGVNFIAVKVLGGDYFINPLIFAYIGGFFCLMGHIFPLYFRFRGGKGVASFAGIMFFIDIKVFLVCFAVFIVVVCISKIISISSILAVIAVPISSYFLYSSSVIYSFNPFGISQRLFISLFSALFAVVIIIKHRTNIKRLINGTENKLTDKKKAIKK